MPHDYSYLWTSSLFWTHLAADSVTGLACYLIPLSLLYLVCKRPTIRFGWMFVLFSIFIFACGTSRFISIWTLWHPDYWIDAAVKVVAAVASVITAALLWRMMPSIVALPNGVQLRTLITQLQHEISERKHMEEALRQSRETLRELAAYQEKIREDERKRIAREIHDELGQNLLALRLEVAMLNARTGDRHPLLRKKTEQALGYIDTTMKSIRNIMNNLRPSVLDLGLPDAIEWQVRQFERRNGMPCELVINDEGVRIDDMHATAIFRILQESLTNIGRHARASAVRVELNVDSRRALMIIEDNGIGMFPGDRRKARRFGLIGIQERASMLGGEVSIESAPGKGTMLRLSIPLQEQPGQAELASA